MRFQIWFFRDRDKVCISIIFISSPNPMFDHLLDLSHQDHSNKWSNIGFDEEITQELSTEVHFTYLIWSSGSFILQLHQTTPII